MRSTIGPFQIASESWQFIILLAIRNVGKGAIERNWRQNIKSALAGGHLTDNIVVDYYDLAWTLPWRFLTARSITRFWCFRICMSTGQAGPRARLPSGLG